MKQMWRNKYGTSTVFLCSILSTYDGDVFSYSSNVLYISQKIIYHFASFIKIVGTEIL